MLGKEGRIAVKCKATAAGVMPNIHSAVIRLPIHNSWPCYVSWVEAYTLSRMLEAFDKFTLSTKFQKKVHFPFSF